MAHGKPAGPHGNVNFLDRQHTSSPVRKKTPGTPKDPFGPGFLSKMMSGARGGQLFPPGAGLRPKTGLNIDVLDFMKSSAVDRKSSSFDAMVEAAGIADRGSKASRLKQATALYENMAKEQQKVQAAQAKEWQAMVADLPPAPTLPAETKSMSFPEWVSVNAPRYSGKRVGESTGQMLFGMYQQAMKNQQSNAGLNLERFTRGTNASFGGRGGRGGAYGGAYGGNSRGGAPKEDTASNKTNAIASLMTAMNPTYAKNLHELHSRGQITFEQLLQGLRSGPNMNAMSGSLSVPGGPDANLKTFADTLAPPKSMAERQARAPGVDYTDPEPWMREGIRGSMQAAAGASGKADPWDVNMNHLVRMAPEVWKVAEQQAQMEASNDPNGARAATRDEVIKKFMGLQSSMFEGLSGLRPNPSGTGQSNPFSGGQPSPTFKAAPGRSDATTRPPPEAQNPWMQLGMKQFIHTVIQMRDSGQITDQRANEMLKEYGDLLKRKAS